MCEALDKFIKQIKVKKSPANLFTWKIYNVANSYRILFSCRNCITHVTNLIRFLTTSASPHRWRFWQWNLTCLIIVIWIFKTPRNNNRVAQLMLVTNGNYSFFQFFSFLFVVLKTLKKAIFFVNIVKKK